MTTVRDLTTGLQAILATALPGVPVVPVKLPQAPDRALAITVVAQGDNTTMPLGSVMVQVRSRGARNDPLDAYDLDAAVFDALQGLTQRPMGACTLITLTRKANVPMGIDTQDRAEVASQFYGEVAVAPTSNRPDGGSW